MSSGDGDANVPPVDQDQDHDSSADEHTTQPAQPPAQPAPAPAQQPPAQPAPAPAPAQPAPAAASADVDEKLGIDGINEGDDMSNVHTKEVATQPQSSDTKFMGKKERRSSSLYKVFTFDYLGAASNKIVMDRISKYGDKKVNFADYAIKVNRRNKMQKRVLLITDAAIYNMDPVNFKVKRRITIASLGSISLSTLPDNFFCLHVPKEYDYLMVSGRKTEIVTVLRMNFQNIKNEELPINFSDGFEYRIGTGTSRQIQFSKVDGGVSTQIFDKKG